MDPCAPIRSTANKTNYEAIEHPDYPGVYYHPSRKHRNCNISEEFSKLKFKILVVRHPLHRLIEDFEAGSKQNFSDYIGTLMVKGSFVPSWEMCPLCVEELMPNYVIKMEHFAQDLQFIMDQMGLPSNQELSNDEISISDVPVSYTHLTLPTKRIV